MSTQVPDAELQQVVKIFGDSTVAVDGISFAVERGEFFSILGPSGCGKSTTLRMIAGLELLTAGEILIRGEAMGRRPAHRRPTNTIFQRPALFPHLTVAANIEFGLKVDRLGDAEIRKRLASVLELVELRGLENRRPHELSGGQQQRVAIARALAKQPTVLLLDEPLSSLDLRLRVQMQRVLKHIQQESGTTFVYVTHDQTEALAMSDRVAVMRDGRIEQIDAPAELYGRPRTRFVAGFVGESNIFDRTANGGGFVSDGLTLHVPGAGVAALVRPERVAIAPRLDLRPDWNVFDATVEEVSFHGANVHYRARLANGRDVVASRPNDAAAPVVPGDRVQVGWGATSVAMLDE